MFSLAPPKESKILIGNSTADQAEIDVSICLAQIVLSTAFPHQPATISKDIMAIHDQNYPQYSSQYSTSHSGQYQDGYGHQQNAQPQQNATNISSSVIGSGNTLDSQYSPRYQLTQNYLYHDTSTQSQNQSTGYGTSSHQLTQYNVVQSQYEHERYASLLIFCQLSYERSTR